MQKAEKSSTYISQKTVTFFAVSAKMGLLLLDKSAIIPSESGKSFVWDNLSTFLKKKEGETMSYEDIQKVMDAERSAKDEKDFSSRRTPGRWPQASAQTGPWPGPPPGPAAV